MTDTITVTATKVPYTECYLLHFEVIPSMRLLSALTKRTSSYTNSNINNKIPGIGNRASSRPIIMQSKDFEILVGGWDNGQISRLNFFTVILQYETFMISFSPYLQSR